MREPARVPLTGATGYVGGHLLDALLERGAQVTCLVRGERDHDAAGRLRRVPPGLRVVAGDIGREGLGPSEAGDPDGERFARQRAHALRRSGHQQAQGRT
ncbi:SDR family oxidoreductase [Streptomyces anulatus]